VCIVIISIFSSRVLLSITRFLKARGIEFPSVTDFDLAVKIATHTLRNIVLFRYLVSSTYLLHNQSQLMGMLRNEDLRNGPCPPAGGFSCP